MLLNNQEITLEIKEEIKKYLETNDNENTMTQNLWEAAKSVLRGKLIAIQSYFKKQETSRINNQILHLKQLKKEEQKVPKINRRKGIIKNRSGGFPGGAVVENLPANAGDTGSSPGLGRSHVLRSNKAREPQILSLRVWSLCSATIEATIVRGPCTAMKSGPRLPQLEKTLVQKRRPNTAKDK